MLELKNEVETICVLSMMMLCAIYEIVGINNDILLMWAAIIQMSAKLHCAYSVFLLN